MSKHRVRCPSRCAGSDRSHKIDPEKLIAAGVTGDWVSDAMECGYCHYIYSNDRDHDGRIYKRIQRGRFRRDLIWPGDWIPTDPRKAPVEYID